MSSISDLLYKGKDITVVLSEAGGAAAAATTTGLSKLFSSESKKLFERAVKPEEFEKKKTVVVDSVEEEVSIKKKKNRKESREAAAAAATSAVTSAATKSSDSSSTDADKSETTEDAKVSDDKEVREKKEARTLFVGNFPVSASIKTVKSLFSVYGEIESVRFRSVPVSGTAVDQSGNQNLVKKVCVNSKKLGDQKQSCNVYIVFSATEAVDLAVAAAAERFSSGCPLVVGDRHVRVDRSSPPTLFDHSRTLFVGGLPYYTDEEELLDHFAKACADGFNDIEGIRIVRDPESLVCKGIAYILFKDRDAVLKGLTLHKQLYKNKQELRVTSCGKRTKSMAGGNASPTALSASISSSKGGFNKKRKVENSDSYERRVKVKHEGRKMRQAEEAAVGVGAGKPLHTAAALRPSSSAKVSQKSIEEDLKRRRISLKSSGAHKGGKHGSGSGKGKGGGKNSFKSLSGGVRRAIKAQDNIKPKSAKGS